VTREDAGVEARQGGETGLSMESLGDAASSPVSVRGHHTVWAVWAHWSTLEHTETTPLRLVLPRALPSSSSLSSLHPFCVVRSIFSLFFSLIHSRSYLPFISSTLRSSRQQRNRPPQPQPTTTNVSRRRVPSHRHHRPTYPLDILSSIPSAHRANRTRLQQPRLDCRR